VLITTWFVPNSYEEIFMKQPLCQNQTLWNTHRKTWIQSQNNLWKITYVNTRNISIAIARLVAIRVARRCDRHRWQKANWFLCTKKPHFIGSAVTKKIHQKRKCPLRRAPNVTFFEISINGLITKLIRGQKFWEVVFFTVISAIAESWSQPEVRGDFKNKSY